VVVVAPPDVSVVVDAGGVVVVLEDPVVVVDAVCDGVLEHAATVSAMTIAATGTSARPVSRQCPTTEA
jgi:hypothetical protein